jgi:IS30 family transposase
MPEATEYSAKLASRTPLRRALLGRPPAVIAKIDATLPEQLRRSLSWDQGSEMCHHHVLAEATKMPVFFCDPGKPWQRPSNENGRLRNYFPRGSNLAVHTAADPIRVSDELDRRPRKTLGWQTPHDLFDTVQRSFV